MTADTDALIERLAKLAPLLDRNSAFKDFDELRATLKMIEHSPEDYTEPFEGYLCELHIALSTLKGEG